MSRYDQIPTVPPRSSERRWVTWKEPTRKYRGPIPPADRSVSCGPSWFCIPGGDWGDGRIFEPYCGAPPGIRCKCGAQLHGHDPGDEDPRRP